MKIFTYFITLLFLITGFSTYSKVANKSQSNYISLRGLLPISLLERDAIYSLGVQLKYNKLGFEVEYGRVFALNSYSQGGQLFDDKTQGDRIRINFKYYFYSLPFTDRIDYHFYVSLMPTIKQVNYKMNWWSYDSSAANNTIYYAESHEPVNYTSKSIALNLLLGNEFYFSFLNVDYYVGVGLKSFDINIPNTAPKYFEPFSNPKNDGVYFNFMLGAKVGFAYKIKRKRLNVGR